MNYFEALNSINVSEKAEKKNGLTYLSWAWAWGELKKKFPASTYTIYEDANGRFYHTDGKTCWVKTGVTVEGIEHIEYLPVMDMRNKSIPADNVTSFDANKAIQRSLTKAVARHGLGLYIYAGEDLPDGETAPVKEEKPAPTRNARIASLCLYHQIDQIQFRDVVKSLRDSGDISIKYLDDMDDNEFAQVISKAHAMLVATKKEVKA